MPPLAVITMVYNEDRRLPMWLGHYSKQVGLEHCYVMDHGSTDGSAARNRKVNVMRLPRSPQDDALRLGFISDMVRGLLRYYERVAYVDADELLVADPTRFANLRDYAEQMKGDAVTSIGLEIVQGEGEKPLVPELGVGKQRQSVLFSSSMCKTNMVGRAVNWAPGLHAHDEPPRFDGLYLFHLRHADESQAMERLQITRAMPWARPDAGAHQRVSDEHMRVLLSLFARRPLAEGTGIHDPEGPLAADLTSFIADTRAPEAAGDPYRAPLGRYGRERVPIDAGFRRALSATPR